MRESTRAPFAPGRTVRTACALLLPALACPGLAADKRPDADGRLLGYDFGRPDAVYELPAELEEASGIAVLSDGWICCVQDEDGILFTYGLESRRIGRTVRFAGAGDYEDLAVVGPTVFVLRSDGLLFEVRDPWGTLAVETHDLPIPYENVEGLGYDAGNHRLLLAPKERAGKGREGKDVRVVFAYDLALRKMLPDPVLTIDLKDLREGAKASLPRFLPSAVAVDPLTGAVFLLSAIEPAVLHLEDGLISGFAVLDPDLFRQPEGIAFLPSGDLLIVNEAAGRRPTLLLFRRRDAGTAEAGP